MERNAKVSSPDLFGRDASCLRDKTLWLFDMDGTIYNDGVLFDGTLDLLDNIHARGWEYVFITNNSSHSLSDYVHKLESVGIPVTEESFFTSTQATVAYLKDQGLDQHIYCQGTRSFVREMQELGIGLTEALDFDVQAIVVGFDSELTGEKLRITSELLTKLPGVPFIAANPDLVCPVSFGYVPDCGSMCQMYENATGRKPLYIGKPEPTLIETARLKNGATKDQTVVIGDRLYTDIASGLNAEVDTVCVLTGEATLDDLAKTEWRPQFVFKSVRDIERLLNQTS